MEEPLTKPALSILSQRKEGRIDARTRFDWCMTRAVRFLEMSAEHLNILAPQWWCALGLSKDRSGEKPVLCETSLRSQF